jgi:hypothetical protein
MGLLKILLKLRKDKTLSICRVSDLFKQGFDPDRLINKFVKLNQEVWGGITDKRYLWSKEMIESHFSICPQFIYCAFQNGVLVATLTNMKTSVADMKRNKTWLEKTGNGFLTTHRPEGDVGFGVDLTVSRKASPGVSNRLVAAAMFVSIFSEGVKAIYLGSRIPGYNKHNPMPVEEYVYAKKNTGKPLDPELYFYLKNRFEIVAIIPDYMEDPESLNYGVLIRWDNPLYWITKALPFLKHIIRSSGKILFLRTPEHFLSVPHSEPDR